MLTFTYLQEEIEKKGKVNKTIAGCVKSFV